MTTNEKHLDAIETLLDETALARFLGCTPAALQLWRRENRGPAYVRVGRLVRYTGRDVKAWIDAQTVRGVSASG